MPMVTDGIVRDRHIEVKIYPQIEHGPMTDVSGIVLHQTSNDYILKTMAAYRFRPAGNGTHFLINPAGQILQTARITQICWHVGRIKAYCQQIHKCTPTDDQMLAKIEKEYKSNKAEKDRMIDAWEQKKSALNRYPTNNDAIGIEVVGAPKGDAYVSPTEAQNQSSRWLVRALILTLQLDRERIFPHGLIDPRKLPTEGGLVAY